MTAHLTRPEGFRGSFERDPGRLAPYSTASGILAARPTAAAIPSDAADVQTLVRWAARSGASLIPRGAGTGMPGGNVGAGTVVDMTSGFRSVHAVDPQRRVSSVQPGVNLAELNARCAPCGLHLPVDPSSGERCTIGGMVANNSAGSHSVKYGATRDWVEAIEVVWSDGSRETVQRGAPPTAALARGAVAAVDLAIDGRRAWIADSWPRVRKNSSGYALREYIRSGDLVDLLVGSEGTLGIMTGAQLRLAALPDARGVALLEFTSLEAAGGAVQALLPLGPSTCEMLDRTFLELVRSAGADAVYPLRPGLEAILLVEVEGVSEDDVADRLAAVADTSRPLAAGASLAVDPAEQRRLWALRHAASPLIAARAGRRVSMQFIEDGVVPIDSLPAYVRLLRSILDRHALPAVIFGHAGDGNLHVNPLVDIAAPRWRDTLEAVLFEVAEGIARLGGTLSGEHGDGRLRAPLLETIWGAEMVGLFRLVKNAFDPAGILNPGVILPLPGQRPFDAIRTFV